jgi:hypothetical protein
MLYNARQAGLDAPQKEGFHKMKNVHARCVRFTMMAMLGLLASLLLGYVAPARAQTAREACTQDAFRLCSDAMPDVERTKACLARNRSSLSPLCRTAFSGGGRTHARHRRYRHR